MVADPGDGRTYVLEPLDTSGVFLGLSGIQCALVGGGIVAAVALVTAGLPVLLAAVPLLAGAGVSFARIGGRPAWEWLPTSAFWAWAGVRRGRRWTAPLPLWATGQSRPPPLPRWPGDRRGALGRGRCRRCRP